MSEFKGIKVNGVAFEVGSKVAWVDNLSGDLMRGVVTRCYGTMLQVQNGCFVYDLDVTKVQVSLAD